MYNQKRTPEVTRSRKEDLQDIFVIYGYVGMVLS